MVHNVNLKELIKIMVKTKIDLDKELKIKISGIEYLESRTNSQIFKSVVAIYIQNLEMMIREIF